LSSFSPLRWNILNVIATIDFQVYVWYDQTCRRHKKKEKKNEEYRTITASSNVAEARFLSWLTPYSMQRT